MMFLLNLQFFITAIFCECFLTCEVRVLGFYVSSSPGAGRLVQTDPRTKVPELAPVADVNGKRNSRREVVG